MGTSDREGSSAAAQHQQYEKKQIKTKAIQENLEIRGKWRMKMIKEG